MKIVLSPEEQRDAFKKLTRAVLSPAARRRAVVDLLFYDCAALTRDERKNVRDTSENPEGSILVVWPSAAGKPIARFPRIPQFLERHGREAPSGDRVQAIALAGVGSSALGTAALARDVADALGVPVAGIVSGMGLSDLVAEGFAGFFLLGLADEISRAVDGFTRAVAPVLERTIKGWHPGKLADLDLYIPGEPDSSALADVLGSGRTAVRFVVGHSKGSLSIWNALVKLHQTPRSLAAPLEDVTFVTIGAPVYASAAVLASVGVTPGRFVQYLGKLDGLGHLNCHSHRGSAFTEIPWACHSLNPRVPFHISVREVLDDVTGHGADASSRGGAAGAPIVPASATNRVVTWSPPRARRPFSETLATRIRAPVDATIEACAQTLWGLKDWAATGFRAMGALEGFVRS